MADPVEMPFGLKSLVGPSNHDGRPDLPWEGANLRGRGNLL